MKDNENKKLEPTIESNIKLNEKQNEIYLINNEIKKENKNKYVSPEEMLEFIERKKHINTNLTSDKKHEDKKAKKKAYFHRRMSFLWVFICILSIIFGISSILSFASDINSIVEAISNEEKWGWKLFNTILHSGEALLFIFYIIFSMFKYKFHHKPWMKWWDETEPIRFAGWIKEEKEINAKLLKKVNVLGLYYTHTNKEYKSDYEKLSGLKEENKIFKDMIKQEMKRRKEVSKANKK